MVLAFSAEALASNVLLSLRFPEGQDAARVQAEIHLTPSAKIPEASPEVLEIEVPGSRAVSLPALGLWRLEVRAPGFWAPSEVISSEESEVAVTLYGAAPVEGQVEIPRGSDLPPVVDLRFSRPEGASPTVPEGTVGCALSEEGRVNCTVPRGSWDLRLRPEGFVSIYRWKQVIGPEGLDLGKITLRPGGSVVGFLEVAKGLFSPTQFEVTLRAVRELAQPADPLEKLNIQTRPDEKGFFQLGGLAEGLYSIRAESDVLATTTLSPIQVFEGRETTLLEPLRAEEPETLEVWVDPPMAPAGRPWTLELTPKGDAPVAEWAGPLAGEADENGFWSRDGLGPGPYHLELFGRRSVTWWSRDVEVGAGMAPFHIRLPMVRVEGRVTLGGEPIRAILWFGGHQGHRRIPMHAREDGRFQGTLPEEGEWVLDASFGPRGPTQALEPVQVERRLGRDYARLDIELPETRLAGVVVDSSGQTVAEAHISLTRIDRLGFQHQTWTDKEGSFQMLGLPAGTYTASASAAAGTSERVEVEIRERLETPDLRLVLEHKHAVQGRVTSPWGPVPGARVLLFPRTSKPATISGAPILTDGTGSFEARVPSTTTEIGVAVLAAGYAGLIQQLPFEADKELRIDLDRIWGTLHLEMPPGSFLHVRATWVTPQLRSGGASLGVQMLRDWARAHGLEPPEGEGRLTVPRMAPGSYQLCLGLGCTQGELAPGGELTLTVPQEAITKARKMFGDP